MHRSLIAVVLCILTHTAAAQCTMAESLAGDDQPGPPIVTTSTSTSETGPRAGGALIKTAAASTRDAPVAARAPQARPTPAANTHDEHPPRSGTAMLLTAIALMSGIALRRYGSNT